MRDRDIDEPLLFLHMKKGEKVHIEGRLIIENQRVSQVCTATTSWVVDEELKKTTPVP